MVLPRNFEDFKLTLHQQVPPKEWPRPLKALWWDAKGNWNRAHDLVDGASMPMAFSVHAYLHRKEGDEWNAGYWYDRANNSFSNVSIEEEWKLLVSTYLSKRPK